MQTGRGHLFYDATHYLLHTLIGCSINQSHFISLSREIDDCVCVRERSGEKKEKQIKIKWQKERFNFSINTEHCRCFFSIRFFSFRSFRQRFSSSSSFPSLFFPFLLLLLLHSSICSSLNVPISSSSVNNFLQCVSVDGQIGLVYNTDVEPVHVISISKPSIIPSTSSTMSHFFHRKTGSILCRSFSRFVHCIVSFDRYEKKSLESKR